MGGCRGGWVVVVMVVGFRGGWVAVGVNLSSLVVLLRPKLRRDTQSPVFRARFYTQNAMPAVSAY